MEDGCCCWNFGENGVEKGCQFSILRRPQSSHPRDWSTLEFHQLDITSKNSPSQSEVDLIFFVLLWITLFLPLKDVWEEVVGGVRKSFYIFLSCNTALQ